MLHAPICSKSRVHLLLNTANGRIMDTSQGAPRAGDTTPWQVGMPVNSLN
jgi:hypothetical protein